MNELDDKSYIRLCTRQNLNKALNTLDGIFTGIISDGIVNDTEIKELRSWCNEHRIFDAINPFNELIPLIDEALSDGVLEEQEISDIQWFLAKALGENPYYDQITEELQYLQGLLHGILADGVVDEDEVKLLSAWLDDNDHLSGCYPYDELYSVIMDVLKDGVVDEDESKFLAAYFDEFVTLSSSEAQANIDKSCKEEISTLGVCAVAPEVIFENKKFCFTGSSKRAKRSEYAEMISAFGGTFSKGVTKDLDYLIYGDAGNKCWAYSCYGRKVEQVVALRKNGSHVILVHENDFWDSYEDEKCS